MKCTKITFEGYKRLADTDCNVSPRILAFVGQNEAGKSSVLNGLAWLTEAGETPLAPLDACRSNKKDGGWIVGARYRFDDEDLAVLEGLGLKDVPWGISLWKQFDGRLHVTFDDPDKPKRDPQPFIAAAQALTAATDRLGLQAEATDEADADDENVGPSSWVRLACELLKEADRKWSDADQEAVLALADWLDETPPNRKRARDAKAAALIRAVAELGVAQHPAEAGLDMMRKRVPKFVAFAEDDRDLPTDTPIHTEEARAGIRPAIRNLLTVAGVDVEELWAACAASDSGEAKTILGIGNERLDAFFGQAWNQANISVHLDVNAHVLTTHIYEIDNKRYTRVEERSDGLRAFVALAAFLEAQNFSTPPILLIDEAETHLHFDAQADLVGVLLKQVKATQIFYTTHSPGCLPSDLGTGVRLLKRKGPTSDIVSHFWTNEAPGFGALLFAMGAGAAAFSACRWAVLAEGPSEMVLLPTLLRRATKLNDLPYQVAPGLSNARAYDMDVEEIAAKVVYLADGDGDGDRYRTELQAAGVDCERIFGLPQGQALEDLLDPSFYLEIVAGMLADGASKPSVKDMQLGIPIARALARWAAQQSPEVELPGKVAVAYAVLDRSEVTLATGAQETLQTLHSNFVAALRRREAVEATTES